MNFVENIRLAIEGLTTNRMRAILTTLGIIIGVGAVIILVSLGRGVENYIASEFQGLGANVLFVFSSAPQSDTRTTIQPLSTVEAEGLASPRVAPSIRQIALETGVFGEVVGPEGSTRLNVSGVTANWQDVRQWFPQPGSAFISQTDVDDAARVAVLGTTIVERLFGDKSFDPVGQTIRINDRPFTIVGVMNEQGAGLGALGDQNQIILIPITTAQTRMSQTRTRDGGYRVDVMYVEAVSPETMESASNEIEAYLNDVHKINFQGEQDFSIINQATILESLGAVTGVLTAFLSLLAGISLLVGGIGIMNIMLVSVTERTREIGLRKAVGARGLDILLQFLIESLVLSLIGGALGVTLGGLGTWLGGLLVPDLSLSITSDAVVLATFVSSFIGIFFGLYPAGRAANMRPIDALRFE
ncbi:MAG: ABC transporter permease [Anaerolineae bacterium]|nr:ABC transporter permease [Anaerolineae bacterium]